MVVMFLLPLFLLAGCVMPLRVGANVALLLLGIVLLRLVAVLTPIALLLVLLLVFILVIILVIVFIILIVLCPIEDITPPSSSLPPPSQHTRFPSPHVPPPGQKASAPPSTSMSLIVHRLRLSVRSFSVLAVAMLSAGLGFIIINIMNVGQVSLPVGAKNARGPQAHDGGGGTMANCPKGARVVLSPSR